MRLLTARHDIQQGQSSGQLLQVFFASIQLDDYRSILDKYGVKEFKADEWYPLELIVEIFGAIENGGNGSQNLVSIGIKVAEVLDMRSQFQTLPELLAVLNDLEHQFHRHNPSRWEVKQINSNCIEVIDATVFPHDLLFGVLYGFARSYYDQGPYYVERVGIERDEKSGDEMGIYHITW